MTSGLVALFTAKVARSFILSCVWYPQSANCTPGVGLGAKNTEVNETKCQPCWVTWEGRGQ